MRARCFRKLSALFLVLYQTSSFGASKEEKRRGYVIPADAQKKGVIVTKDPSQLKKKGVTLFDPTLLRKMPEPPKKIVAPAPKKAAPKLAKKEPMKFSKQVVSGDVRQPRVAFDADREASRRADEDFQRSFGSKLSEDLLRTYNN